MNCSERSTATLTRPMSFAGSRLIAIAVLICLASHSSLSFAEAALVYGKQLKEILRNLTDSVPAAQSEQIIGALNASPSLGRQLDRLASEGRLTAIIVATKIPMTNGLQLGGTIVETSIYFSSSFLALLQQNFSDDRHIDDLAANNTVFALGDLAYLMATDAEMAAALKTLDKDAFVRKAMTRKANALIQGWDDVVEAAAQANHGKDPTPGQIGTLLLNMRYRAVFLQAQDLKAGPLFIPDSGMIERNDANISALVSVLGNMKVMDLE
jgi:hypothetical protein